MVDRMKILGDVVGAKNFAVDDIVVDASRCIAARGGRISCRACSEICPAEAVKVVERAVEIDGGRCTHCGACVTVCPVQALSSAWNPREELVEKAVAALGPSGGRPVLACAKACEGASPDPLKVVQMECLEGIDEALILLLLAIGAQDIRLVSGDCLSCATGCLGAVWTLVVERANDMAASVLPGGEPVATSFGELPGDVLATGDADSDFSRRDLFGDLRKKAARVAGDVMEGIAEDERYRSILSLLGMGTGPKGDDPATAERWVVCARSLRVIALKAERGLGTEEGSVLESCLERLRDVELPSRIFSDVEIDGTRCTSCFLCVSYCQTKAVGKLMEGHRVTGFSIAPWLCNQCGACVDVCRPGAISLTGHISLGTLLTERPEHILYDDWR